MSTDNQSPQAKPNASDLAEYAAVDEGAPEFDTTVADALAECHAGFKRYLRYRLPSHAEADDVLQDFYVRVLNKSAQIRKAESVRAWLRKVLTSVLADHYRKRASVARSEANLPLTAWAPVSEDEEIELVVCDCISALLPALKPEYAEILRRADILAEPRREIAESLNTTTDNVRVQLHRARKALRRALELSCQTCPEHGFLKCQCPASVEFREHVHGQVKSVTL